MAREPRTIAQVAAQRQLIGKFMADSLPPSIWPLAAKMPSAMGKSNRPESLGKSAGARFTVMRLLAGNSSPAFWMAERTRSRASLTSVSASPTSVKLGEAVGQMHFDAHRTCFKRQQGAAMH